MLIANNSKVRYLFNYRSFSVLKTTTADKLFPLRQVNVYNPYCVAWYTLKYLQKKTGKRADYFVVISVAFMLQATYGRDRVEFIVFRLRNNTKYKFTYTPYAHKLVIDITAYSWVSLPLDKSTMPINIGSVECPPLLQYPVC
jgi:hypothetical protein